VFVIEGRGDPERPRVGRRRPGRIADEVTIDIAATTDAELLLIDLP
jgi:hypothetical protein